ncbi:MAG: aminotransferase class III-fold pyridoxal phosphate-dependent enzyme, partial [Firmicutes bacterium]|nr:aminotransferase class III-fold pyridoxal phosphate-dependent enzyme [Bacillota bacterium]
FKEMQKRYPLIGDVRGKGAMVAFELVKDRASKEPAPEAAKIITQECYQKGLIAISAGIYSNVMRFLPPLVITKEQLDTALKILEEAVATAQEKLE